LGVGEVGVVSSDFHRLTGATANENLKIASQIKRFVRLFRGHAPKKHPGFLFQTYSYGISSYENFKIAGGELFFYCSVAVSQCGGCK
jgi:hypothetical protein